MIAIIALLTSSCSVTKHYWLQNAIDFFSFKAKSITVNFIFIKLRKVRTTCTWSINNSLMAMIHFSPYLALSPSFLLQPCRDFFFFGGYFSIPLTIKSPTFSAFSGAL